MVKQLFLIAFLISSLSAYAQNFIGQAVIEYEVKVNIKKTMGNSSWAEKLKESMPQFKTGYYHLTFSDNKSIYRHHHWDEKLKMPEFLKRGDEENVWYADYTTNTLSMQKSIFGSMFNVEDKLPKIEWRLTNENRIIAGFNCRKAVGKIMDSVYVFAFYTEEILLPGGPCTLNGLPGVILGATIPRLYASWIATKVQVNDVTVSDIKPVPAKKPFTMKSFEGTLVDRTKEWGDSDDPDSKNWMEQLYWNALL